MLDQTTRAAILRLRLEGHGSRRIASALGISRNAVREVLRAGSAEVPRLERTELGDAHRADIAVLYADCKGNLVRVQEKLHDAGATLSYQALTAFCRRHGIGKEPVKPAGQYHFGPGEEMQHDTSPHDAKILAGREFRDLDDLNAQALAWCDKVNATHRPPRGQGGTPSAPAVEERQLLEAAPEIAGYVAALKRRAAGRGTVALRRLQRLLREYPRRPVIEAVRAAETYGLFDLERLERMVLRGIARDFFPPAGGDGEGHDDE